MTDNTTKFSFSKCRQLYQFVWRQSSRQQMLVCSIALITLPLTLAPIELQRRIIDDAVGDRSLVLLAWLAGIYAAVVVLQQVTKFCYNYYRARLTESVVRHLREVILSSVDSDIDNEDAGTVVSMLSGEVEPIGGFTGSAYAQLITEGGVLIGVFGYMLYTEFWLALFAIAAFIPQALATPLVQNQINERAAKRIAHVRGVGDDAVAISRGDDERIGTAKKRIRAIYLIRLLINRLKFSLKALLNLFDHLADLAVLAMGGYMVIIGETNIGIVVAFLSGLSQLRSPWRTLISYFRVLSETQIRFGLLQEQLPEQVLLVEKV